MTITLKLRSPSKPTKRPTPPSRPTQPFRHPTPDRKEDIRGDPTNDPIVRPDPPRKPPGK
jgi:hypothetical protein